MSNPIEVINRLNRELNYLKHKNVNQGYVDKYQIASLEFAINILEKEIPKISGCDICDDTSNSRYYKNNKYRYCPYCGQKLEWSED